MNSFSGSVATALSLIANFDPGLVAIVLRSLAVSWECFGLAFGVERVEDP
jgi:hypothetical protein